jgi:glycosyltransferase involved in cell wall biosynthesis
MKKKPFQLSSLHSWLMNMPFLFKTARKLVSAFPGLEFKVKRLLAISKLNPKQNTSSTETTIAVDPNLSIAQQELIFIYVEHTAYKTHVTGITRVVTKLIESLCNLGKHVVLVKLSEDMSSLAPLSAFELENFKRLCPAKLTSLATSLLNPINFANALTQLQSVEHRNWLILPEVPYHTFHKKPATAQLFKLARGLGLQTGGIFYDNIPLEHTADKHHANKHADYLAALAQADATWAISHFSNEQLKTYYHTNPSFNKQNLPCMTTLNLPEIGQAKRETYDWNTPDKTILCLGSICQRKNQLTLVQAFNSYCQDNPNTNWQLALVGQFLESDYMRQVKKEACKNHRITIYNKMNDNELEKLYQRTPFTVFASVLEGYGLPIVESLWRMRPCICANHGPMADIAKPGGCIAIDTSDPTALLSALKQLMDDRAYYQQKLDEIKTRPMTSWDDYAQNMLEQMQLKTDQGELVCGG